MGSLLLQFRAEIFLFSFFPLFHSADGVQRMIPFPGLLFCTGELQTEPWQPYLLPALFHGVPLFVHFLRCLSADI